MIGQRIKQRREQLGISQSQLASTLGYKSKAAISKIETDVNSVSRSKVPAFAKALFCSESYLLGFTDVPDIPRNVSDMQNNRETQVRQILDMISTNQVNDFEYQMILEYRNADSSVKRIVEYALGLGNKQKNPHREGDVGSPAD